MNADLLLQQLKDSAERIRLLVTGVSPEQAHWRPDPDSWSIVEVMNHLYDEEREDFRVRLDIILHDPDHPWPPIDPAGWVTARGYNQRELEPSLQNFLAERRASLSWLATLQAPNWEATVTNRFGSMRAGDMFSAWVAHDSLHMRQLVELHHAWTVHLATPYSTDYAGPW